VPFLNSQSHQITHCALRGANSSHKILKHYLGGRKQLDSLESRHIQTSSNRNGGGQVKRKKKKKSGNEEGKHSVHDKVYLNASSIVYFCLLPLKEIETKDFLLSLLKNQIRIWSKHAFYSYM